MGCLQTKRKIVHVTSGNFLSMWQDPHLNHYKYKYGDVSKRVSSASTLPFKVKKVTESRVTLAGGDRQALHVVIPKHCTRRPLIEKGAVVNVQRVHHSAGYYDENCIQEVDENKEIVLRYEALGIPTTASGTTTGESPTFYISFSSSELVDALQTSKLTMYTPTQSAIQSGINHHMTVPKSESDVVLDIVRQHSSEMPIDVNKALSSDMVDVKRVESITVPIDVGEGVSGVAIDLKKVDESDVDIDVKRARYNESPTQLDLVRRDSDSDHMVDVKKIEMSECITKAPQLQDTVLDYDQYSEENATDADDESSEEEVVVAKSVQKKAAPTKDKFGKFDKFAAHKNKLKEKEGSKLSFFSEFSGMSGVSNRSERSARSRGSKRTNTSKASKAMKY